MSGDAIDRVLSDLPLAADERRREPRYEAEGPVEFRVTQPPLPRVIQGALQDLSSSGFRATHPDRYLENGEVVEFAFAGRSGKARVIWNRLSGGAVESGFWILE
jgi:hypothetical protein